MTTDSSARILIVDDARDVIRLLTAILAQEGFITSVADNGKDALKAVSAKPPDLILLDMIMPVMDGFETLQLLKQDEAMRNVPVICMTALSKPKDKLKGFQLGAVDYITKPIHIEEVVARVRTHVTLGQLRRDLQEKNTRLTILNEDKNRFLSMVAHDLKNPLNIIGGFTRIVRESLNTKSKELLVSYLQIIEKNSLMMYDLIEDLLNVNSIECGMQHSAREFFDLEKKVLTVIDNYSPCAKSKGIDINFSCLRSPTAIKSNERAVHQILENLISNAVKYSPLYKNIAVTISGDNDTVRVAIQDKGPGLTEDDRKKLFGKFNRLSAQPTGGESTNGLGLYIVKSLIEGLNGRIWCESISGQGAKFIFEIPDEHIKNKL